MGQIKRTSPARFGGALHRPLRHLVRLGKWGEFPGPGGLAAELIADPVADLVEPTLALAPADRDAAQGHTQRVDRTLDLDLRKLVQRGTGADPVEEVLRPGR
jgi:hypothetical protein